MNSTPLVSVLVPVYNVEKYLDECIDSIESQTYKNLEVIFVNDGSTDRSLDILNRRKRNNYIVISQQNSGSASTRNTCMHFAKGEFICFLDSDDMLTPAAIEKMVEVALENEADIVRGRLVRFTTDTEQSFKQSSPDDVVEFRKAFLEWSSFQTGVCGGIYRRSLFSENDLWFYEGLNFGEDFAMNCRVAYFAKRVANIDMVIYRYRINQDSMTVAFKEIYATELFEISDRIKAFYEEKADGEVYSNVIKNGRAKIKSVMLFQLPADISPKYAGVFPDLQKGKDLSFFTLIKLRAMEHNCRLIFRIIHKLEGIFK